MPLDISEVKRITRRASYLFGRIPARMLRIGTWAARFERDSHAYHNRTGKLEASTLATVSEGADEATLTLDMGMPYASYVDDLGYSNIGEAAGMIDHELSAGFEAMGHELEGM